MFKSCAAKPTHKIYMCVHNLVSGAIRLAKVIERQNDTSRPIEPIRGAARGFRTKHNLSRRSSSVFNPAKRRLVYNRFPRAPITFSSTKQLIFLAIWHVCESSLSAVNFCSMGMRRLHRISLRPTYYLRRIVKQNSQARWWNEEMSALFCRKNVLRSPRTNCSQEH